MAENSEETNKIVRTTLESLAIFVTNDELVYRNKYLPDPRRLSDDKIVCTVCSASLVSQVRNGKNLQIHAILGVLVCKKCRNFYGDGIFSTDEDGDDKYCRWCGQGGTLYLCSKCNCGFCKKCMTKNMKNSALTEIERDDWKCLICIPRPIYGSRAVCWAAQMINSTARKNERYRNRLAEEKLKQEAEGKTHSNDEKPGTSVKKAHKTNKRALHSDDSDSSTVFIPTKKPKRDADADKCLNGSVKKHRRKGLSSHSESSDNLSNERKLKSRNRRESSSSEPAATQDSKVEKRRAKNQNRRSRYDSDSDLSMKKRNRNNKEHSSSDSDDGHSSKMEKRKNKSKNNDKASSTESDSNSTYKKERRRSKKKTKYLSSSFDEPSPKKKEKRNERKKTSYTSSDESFDSDEVGDKSTLLKKKRIKSSKTNRKNKLPKRKEITSDSSNNDPKEKCRKKKKRHSRHSLSSDQSCEEDIKLREHKESLHKNDKSEKFLSESDSHSKIINARNEVEPNLKDLKARESEEADTTLVEKKPINCAKADRCNQADEDESKAQATGEVISVESAEKPGVNKLLTMAQNASLNEDDYTLSYHGSGSFCDDKIPLSQEEEVSVKVELAIEWLNGVSSDIADLGSVIAERATKFGEKRINVENMRSDEDVFFSLEKVKHLLENIHFNYKQIEDDLEDKLKSWKILAGLEKSDLEDQVFCEDDALQAEDVGPVGEEFVVENELETKMDKGEIPAVSDDFSVENELETKLDEAEIPVEDQQSVATEDQTEISSEITTELCSEIKTELCSEITTELCSERGTPLFENEIHCSETSINENEKNIVQGNMADDIVINEEFLVNIKKENKILEGSENLENNETLEVAVDEKQVSLPHNVEKDERDILTEAQSNFRRSRSNLIWKGLLSSDEESDIVDNFEMNRNDIDNDESTIANPLNLSLSDVEESETNNLTGEQIKKVDDIDDENFEALQELLGSSTEPDVGSSESGSNDSSDDVQLDDSDLENLIKPRKIITKKTLKKKDKKEIKVDEKINDKVESDGDSKIEKALDENPSEKKGEEPLDSEAEIDMLTDLTKLKKKTVLKRVEEGKEESSSESSSEASRSSEPEETKKKRKKYNREIKKKRERERNELFGFLEGDSSAEDEVDITKNDLNKMEDQYVSESSDSQCDLEEFGRRMNERWRELEKEQDQLNLQLLLASDSEQGSDGGDALVLDSDEGKKKKKDKKPKEDKTSEAVDDANIEKEDTDVEDVKEGEEKIEEKASDEGYEQFLEGLSKTKTNFVGLGSSSDEDKGKISSSDEDKGKEDIDIKEELLSDQEAKVKKQPKGSGNEDGSSSDSDSSSDLFLDITKKSSEKKTVWRQHKLLKMKLSDTDTSDEERWWQRRLEREKKKKEEGDSTKKPRENHMKENGSDKENKKMKKKKQKEEEHDSSSLEMSSTDSSGSDVFKKKKKKKNESSDSDVVILSDGDKKKKKKKKKMNLSGDSSGESGDSGDDVIDITQKSSQGESPGKGGRKNIRKVLTKHELAAATKAANREEEERKKRIAARQKLFNEMFEIKEAEVLEKLVLDFDPETKTELISVDKDLVTKMKPHQAKGVKFMWDSCFESLNEMKTKKGSGCILAHCMGLGKTFQVVSLVHTILTHKDTNVRTVLVVCPLSTVLNWYNEFDKWLDDVAGGSNIKTYHLTKFKKAHERSRQLSLWQRTGGVMILGYDIFRILANPNCKKFRLIHTEVFQKTLINPGADLVVCDEGHMLKNETTLLSKAMSRIRTLRRIVLTGTPMQNNLKEYHCMVQFVKPNLLGTRKEFLNQFVNPITNGQFVDSTESDVKVMKRRAHVLHKMLEGLVQRCDYSVLTPFLPPKHEYVISLKLSEVQVKLYQFYLDKFCRQNSDDKRISSQLFQDWQVLGRIWTHPRVLKMSTDKTEKEKQESESEDDQRKLRSQRPITDFLQIKYDSSPSRSSKQESEDEGSLKNFINDKSSSSLSLSSSSSDDENGEKKEKKKKKKKKDSKEPEKKKEDTVKEVVPVAPVDEINLISSDEEDGNKPEEVIEIKESQTVEIDENKANDSGIEDGKNEPNAGEEKSMETDAEDKNKADDKQESKEDSSEKKDEAPLDRRGAWWKDIIEPEHLDDINQSSKLILLFAILRECELIGDKVLVFSQSLFSLDLIEYFLQKVDQATEENRLDESLGNHAGCWTKGVDYFRLDGSLLAEGRSALCKSFNREDNPRARLFLISTRAGGQGINLTGANRVIIFDASWNPSHDVQSIFRIYRFGQKKPCYVYRFVAQGTMEEKVYDRQVAKQLLSSRVVDEQQVHRHFSMSDLNELYTFTPPQDKADKPTPVLPKDRLMAELLTQYSDWIEKYHEHDSLLENIADEELNEEERKLAWEDYENEKKREFVPPMAGTGGNINYSALALQNEQFRKSLRAKFPTATDAEVNAMLQTLSYQVSYNNRLPQQQQQQVNAGPSHQQQKMSAVNTSGSGLVRKDQFSQMVQNIQNQMQRNGNQLRLGNQPSLSNRQINQQNIANRQITQQSIGNRQMNQQNMGNRQMNQPAMGNRQINLQRIGNRQMNQQSMGNRQMNQQSIGNRQMNQQNMGNRQMNQQNMGSRQMNQQSMRNRQVNQQSLGNRQLNQQMIGNGEIKKNMNSSQESFRDQMRKQQEANLARIQNQRSRYQQQQNNAGQQPAQQRNAAQQQFNNASRMYRPTPPQTNLTQQRWKPNQTPVFQSNQPLGVTTNRTQQMQNRRENAVSILNSKPPLKPRFTQASQQEQMRQRIERLKRQQALQPQQKQKKKVPIPPNQQQQLDAMMKRYNASRMKSTSAASSEPISIVEIDDEPGT